MTNFYTEIGKENPNAQTTTTGTCHMWPLPVIAAQTPKSVGHSRGAKYSSNNHPPARDLLSEESALKARYPIAKPYLSAHSTCKCTTIRQSERIHQPTRSGFVWQTGPPESSWIQARYVDSIRFHLIGFTSSLTLSSKCFATFPHGTCLLSVS